MLTDLQLLSRYHAEGDATAFRDLVQAHAGMVFATARRITRDEAMAEDVAQETFLQLARQARHITQSVAAWLHRVAWRRACNAVRDDATRRRIEAEAAATEAAVREPPECEATWAEVEAVLDEAVDELPDNLRGPLVMHFLQGRTQRDIADQLEVNQSTVSRLVDEGLAVLRSRLKSRGLLCGAGLAALLMANNAAAAAPAALLASLGKLSMSGIGAASATPVATGALAFPWLKAGIAALLTAGAVVVMKSPTTSTTNADREVILESPTPSAQFAPQPKPSSSAVAAPAVAIPAMPPSIASAPTASATAPAIAKPMPVHELVHSFPTPPKSSGGDVFVDDDGMLWGTCAGGHYGCGALYRMKLDGSEWQEVLSFNGDTGGSPGGWLVRGVRRAPDGRLWGATVSGNKSAASTIFNFDPRTSTLQTEVVMDAKEWLTGIPTILPDGEVWFSTSAGVWRCHSSNSPNGARQLVKRRSPQTATSSLTDQLVPGELTPDGRGWMWATSESPNHGAVCKINMATGEMVILAAFTGTSGTCPGSAPVCGLTMDADGFLWGCTRKGGAADRGTVFKIHAETGAFTSVAHFQTRDGIHLGAGPETRLADDGQGFMWGTASYTVSDSKLNSGHGTIYKVERSTGMLSLVTAFTGVDGVAPGGPARGHLLRVGADSFVGASGFGGRSDSGVVYRVDVATGRYAVLTHFADQAWSAEGSEPHGELAETSDGSLWGVTTNNGAHACGTIYKLDPASQRLVSMVDFTGRDGAHPGRFADAGLVGDGNGWLWGTTRFGGLADAGTLFKVHEQTGEFVTIAEFGVDRKRLPGSAPMSELVLDERGQLWGGTSTTIFKVDARSHAVKTIAILGGDAREPFGTGPVGKMAVDGRGHVWGCALGDRLRQKATLFRIGTADDRFEIVEVFSDALAGWQGWHPQAEMFRDRSGSIWFTGVLEHGGPKARCSLNRLDPLSGRVVERHGSRAFPFIDTPVEDGHGRLWGATAMFGLNDALYTFDLSAGTFQRSLEFTGHGSQSRAGGQPAFGRPMRASDGNIYSVTRYGGPGNGGTIYRLRFGPTPMTQEAVILADGRVELHGVLRPNGRDTTAAFEWGTDPSLKDARVAEAGTVRAGEVVKSVQALLAGLPRDTTHYFRLRGINPDNAVPQRGAILSFVIPAEETKQGEALLAAASKDSVSGADAAAQASAQAAAPAQPAKKHRLRIIMVPGAGAGIVHGWLRGEAYEIGKTYSLTSQADNGYVFAHWSGRGIGGPVAANPQLNFTFTKELAERPFITATFVRNPFYEGVLGPYHGLVYALEGVQPGIDTTGALELNVEELGDFTGTLRYDGDALPIEGTFDTGGSARFGEQLAFTALIPRAEKPALLLSLQLNLAEDGSGGIVGFVGLWKGEQATWQSQLHVMHDVPSAFLAEDPFIKRLTGTGSLNVELLALDSGEVLPPARMSLQPDGRLQLSANLPDGTALLGDAHLSRQSQLSFFQLLTNGEGIGSFGVDLPLSHLLQRPEQAGAQGWWLPPAGSMRPITVQGIQTEPDGR